jgi:hypothetical protein
MSAAVPKGQIALAGGGDQVKEQVSKPENRREIADLGERWLKCRYRRRGVD